MMLSGLLIVFLTLLVIAVVVYALFYAFRCWKAVSRKEQGHVELQEESMQDPMEWCGIEMNPVSNAEEKRVQFAVPSSRRSETEGD